MLQAAPFGCPGGKVADFLPVKAVGQEKDPHPQELVLVQGLIAAQDTERNSRK